MLDWDEVMKQLYDAGYVGKRSEFAALRGILSYLGSPQEKLRIVHIAGTNGKGSASRMMQEILTRAGYRTGLFISPHLQYMNERWTIDGRMISDEDLRAEAVRTRGAVETYNRELRDRAKGVPGRGADHTVQGVSGRSADHPAEEIFSGGAESQRKESAEEIPEEKPVSFALLTIMAFDYFARKGCDIVVLEVGIGGRLDSTNVIPVPELAVIMNIGLEHTELLGNTPEKIANEKGGIIKPGGEVVLYHQDPEVEGVIRGICRERGAKLTITKPELLYAEETGTEGKISSDQDLASTRYAYREYTGIRLNLEGLYQRSNMLAVLEGVDVLRRRGWNIPEAAVREGLARVTWPGRFEILSRRPLVIVDGAHNPNGIEALLCNLEDPKGPAAGRRILFVVGIMADKDVPEILRLLAPHACGFIMETAPGDRAESAEELCAEARQYYHGPVRAASSMRGALTLALQQTDGNMAVVCCGSLYQVAEIREYFGAG